VVNNKSNSVFVDVFLFACEIERLDDDFSAVLTTSFVLLALHSIIARLLVRRNYTMSHFVVYNSVVADRKSEYVSLLCQIYECMRTPGLLVTDSSDGSVTSRGWGGGLMHACGQLA
jgi:hypothetical protein